MKRPVVAIGIAVLLLCAAGLLVLYATPRSRVLQPTPTLTPTVSQPTIQPQGNIPEASSEKTTHTSNPSSTASSATSSTRPPNNTISGNQTASTWPTSTNPQGLYSIQYPNDYGRLNVEYTTRGAVLSWDALDGSFTVDIGSVDNPQYLNLQQWLAKQGWGAPKETISVNGMEGVIYVDEPSPGNTKVYLTRTINGFPFIYDIDFICSAYGCSLPPFWRQMLNSFQGLPANS